MNSPSQQHSRDYLHDQTKGPKENTGKRKLESEGQHICESISQPSGLTSAPQKRPAAVKLSHPVLSLENLTVTPLICPFAQLFYLGIAAQSNEKLP